MKALAIMLAMALAGFTPASAMVGTRTEPQTYTVDGYFEMLPCSGSDLQVKFIPLDHGYDCYTGSAAYFGLPDIGPDYTYQVTIDAGKQRACKHDDKCPENGYCYKDDNEIIKVAPMY